MHFWYYAAYNSKQGPPSTLCRASQNDTIKDLKVPETFPNGGPRAPGWKGRKFLNLGGFGGLALRRPFVYRSVNFRNLAARLRDAGRLGGATGVSS
jgi:hypothetical protein